MTVSAGWQHFILHDFIAEANEKFKKEDEKEERGGDKRKKKNNQSTEVTTFFPKPFGSLISEVRVLVFASPLSSFPFPLAPTRLHYQCL